MNEDAFRKIADTYVTQSGAGLRRELNELPQDETHYNIRSLDRRVYTEIRALKRRRYSRIAGLAAACLVLVLLIPSVLYVSRLNGAPSGPASGSIASPAPPVYEVIPLSFTMPEQFTVASVEQDIEKTVYILENDQLDNVVMTLEETDNLELFGELTPLSISGHSAYGSAGQGYCLLAFEKQGVLYVLTCVHDINTLVELSRSILVSV